VSKDCTSIVQETNQIVIQIQNSHSGKNKTEKEREAEVAREALNPSFS